MTNCLFGWQVPRPVLNGVLRPILTGAVELQKSIGDIEGVTLLMIYFLLNCSQMM